ncbi:MAG: hypothetical protein IT572_08650 [Deltaproteobacteria bacterium]|nr:hypothetical protein [Deltaproteobacteria bacterium]
MSGPSFSGILSDAKSFFFGEEIEAKRNLKVRLADPDATRIEEGTRLRVQDGAGPVRQVTVREHIGTPGQDSQYQGMGDPSIRLKGLLDSHQYRHASNDAKVDAQGLTVEPNGALVAPLPRPKVSVEVESSKVRPGDTVLEADTGAVIVPTGLEHAVSQAHQTNAI